MLPGSTQQQRVGSGLAAVAGASVLATAKRDTVVDQMGSKAAAGPWLLDLLATLYSGQIGSAELAEPKAAAEHRDSGLADLPWLASHSAHFVRHLYFFVHDCVNQR